MKAGRLVFAVVFLLISAFCFFAISREFSFALMLVGIACILLAIYAVYKAFNTGTKKKNHFEL